MVYAPSKTHSYPETPLLSECVEDFFLLLTRLPSAINTTLATNAVTMPLLGEHAISIFESITTPFILCRVKEGKGGTKLKTHFPTHATFRALVVSPEAPVSHPTPRTPHRPLFSKKHFTRAVFDRTTVNLFSNTFLCH